MPLPTYETIRASGVRVDRIDTHLHDVADGIVFPDGDGVLLRLIDDILLTVNGVAPRGSFYVYNDRYYFAPDDSADDAALYQLF